MPSSASVVIDDEVEKILRLARGIMPSTPDEQGPASKRRRITDKEKASSSFEAKLQKALFESLRFRGDDPRHMDQFVQWLYESCCCSRAKALIMLQMGVPALLLAALQKWPKEADLQVIGFIWVKGMVKRLDFPDAFLSMGWFETILDAMQFHGFSVSIQLQGITTLATLLEFEDETFLDDSDDLLLEKVLVVVLQSMQQVPTSHIVQQKGCELLGHLSTCAKTRNSFRSKLLQSNAVAVVRRAKEDKWSHHWDEMKNLANQFLKNMEELPGALVRQVRCNLSQIFTAEVTDTTVIAKEGDLPNDSGESSSCLDDAQFEQTMRRLLFQGILQNQDATLVDKAFGTISSLVAHDEDRAITATLMGVHAAAIVAMRTWPDDRTVQKNGMVFLNDLIRSLPLAATDWPIRSMIGHMLEWLSTRSE